MLWTTWLFFVSLSDDDFVSEAARVAEVLVEALFVSLVLCVVEEELFSLSDDECCEFLEELRFRLALNDLALFSDSELFEDEVWFSADWLALLDVSASVLELALVLLLAEPGPVVARALV